MKRFEYRLIDSRFGLAGMVDELQVAGRDGWEAFFVEPDAGPSYARAMVRRESPEPGLLGRLRRALAGKPVDGGAIAITINRIEVASDDPDAFAGRVGEAARRRYPTGG